MDFKKLRGLLDESYQWPDYYEFKFIIKTSEKHRVKELLLEFKLTETLSKNGKYTSVSAKKLIHKTEEILEIYELVSKIEGVISL